MSLLAAEMRSLPAFRRNGVVAVLEIPRISLRQEVRTGQHNLDRGVVLDPYSVAWGEPGTVELYGHRTTFTAPFRDLGELVPGDDVFVFSSPSMEPWHYVVAQTRDLVPLSDPQFTGLARRVWDEAMGLVDHRLLSVRTCSPPFSDTHRLIVTAECMNPIGTRHA